MTWFETIFGKWVVKYRWWIIIATLPVVFMASSGMRFLTVNNDTRVFFSEDNPQLQALEALEGTFSKDNTVLFALAPKDGHVFTRKTLAVVEALTEAPWQMPYSSRVDSVANFQHARAEEDDLIVEDLVQGAEGLSDADLERVKEIAISEPLLVNNVISPSGHVTGVFVTILLPGQSLKEVPDVTAFARKLADDIRTEHPDIDVYLTGTVISDNAFGEASQNDMANLYPLMFLTLVIVIGLSLRSFWGTLATLLIILFSMLSGLGTAGWLGIGITAASVNAPVLILTLSVADSMHVLVTMFQFMRDGKSKHEAISESLRINVQAVFITSITTAIGFLTMNFSDAPPFRDMGNIVAIGVMAAFFYSVLFLPALMAVLPIRMKPQQKRSDCRSCDWLANLIVKHRKLVFWGTLTVIVLLTVGITQIDLNDNFLEYFDESYDFKTASDFVIDNLRGWDTIEYSLESGEPGGINNPEYLATVAAFTDWYRQQARVVHVNSITDTMKRLNKNMHGDDVSWYRLPEQRDLAAQYLLLYEMSLPFGLDLNNRINIDKSSTRLTVTLESLSATEVRETDEKAQAWLRANAPESMFTYGTGISVMWAHITGRNIKSMLIASFWALLLISGILVFALKNVKLGVLSLIPNLAPAIMAFGVWGLLKGQVGLGLSIIVSMTIGIVVDDTVHFLSKYLRARREHDLDPAEAVRYSFHTVGAAMWITTVVLVCGFLVLTFSGYKMNADMGWMSAITITLALIMDFMLLPTLLMAVDKSTVKQPKPVSQRRTKTMKPAKLISHMILILLVFPLAATAQSPAEKGLTIAQEADKRDMGFDDVTANMRMILKNKRGQESIRDIRIKTLEVKGDGDKSLSIFDNPRDVKGTAFLTFTHKVGDDDQWLYLPALKRVKRISSRNKSGSFMGSEFAYEDVTSQEVEKYTYKWIRDEMYEGQDCFVIERYPVDKKNSGYTRLVSWIDKSEYRERKVEFYDRKKSLLKTLTIQGYKQYLDKHWRPDGMNMVNHQNGKSTQLVLSNYKFRTGLTDGDFNQNSLKRAR